MRDQNEKIQSYIYNGLLSVVIVSASNHNTYFIYFIHICSVSKQGLERFQVAFLADCYQSSRSDREQPPTVTEG